MCITFFRNTVDPSKRCTLFENVHWLDCHKDEWWTKTNSICAYESQQRDKTTS